MLLGHMPLSRDPMKGPKLQKSHTTATGSSLLTTPSKLPTRTSVSRPHLTKSKTSVQEDDNYMNSIFSKLLILSSKQMDVVKNLFEVNKKDTRARSISVSLMSL